jgi:hypothetical protein
VPPTTAMIKPKFAVPGGVRLMRTSLQNARKRGLSGRKFAPLG